MKRSMKVRCTLWLLLALSLCSLVSVESIMAQNTTVKYVYAIDYPLAGKTAYLEWVKSVGALLQAPEEINRIASYDNYFGASPHRFIEFEFDNLAAAAQYFSRVEIQTILAETVNHGINSKVTVLKMRSDYQTVGKPAVASPRSMDYANTSVAQSAKQAAPDNANSRVKYLYAIDYPLAGKTAYLEWVKSVGALLQTPEEINRIASYDNYFGASPHRFIEFEFDNLAAAGKYFSRPEIESALSQSVNHGINAQVTVLKLRGDYEKE